MKILDALDKEVPHELYTSIIYQNEVFDLYRRRSRLLKRCRRRNNSTSIKRSIKRLNTKIQQFETKINDVCEIYNIHKTTGIEFDIEEYLINYE